MDTSKIIKGVVNSGRYTVTAPIIKEDYGLYLQIEGVELPQTYQVDFSNDEHHGTSVTMIGNADGVLIPHQFISSGKDVFAFLYHVGADFGRTVYKFRIPNKCRPDRTEETPTPEEQSTIDQCISALNEAVAQTAEDRENADASAQSAYESADEAQQARDNAQTYANNAQTSANNASASASQASASATASAQSASQSAQIKADVEDLVDDAQGYAQASERSASASANSASQAQGYAQSASASAQSASGYATQAQTSAQTASAKASEASTSASTASAKATEASQSASQALSYKTDAESAKTASQTAQGLAESARDLAQGYAEDAQGYAEDAQASAESISASASQIAQNTANILKAFPTDTASGSIASFPDGADDLPLKSLVVDINPIQDLSNGDPSPENICPISGWTEVDVEQSGVNVWDEEWEVGTLSGQTGLPAGSTLQIRSKNFCRCTPNVAYYGCCEFSRNYMNVFWYDENKDFISVSAFSQITTSPVNAHFFRIRSDNQYGNTYKNDVSLNYPSTDHDYHPYTGRSITIPLGQTVYGGKLDVLSGVLVVERKCIDLSNVEFIKDSAGYFQSRANATIINDAKHYASGEVANLISSQYVSKAVASVKDNNGSCGMYWYATDNRNIFRIRDDRYSDAQSFMSAMVGVQLCYELATPITIQLTPNQVNSLLGVNNIWADSGDTEVKYRADTKLFIERLTAPDSADMIADANIQSGKYFMVGNNLYKATANIANGSAIVVGTNCTRKSLSEALNEINA